MNLLEDSWLPMQLADGSQQSLPLSQIFDKQIIDFALPRQDFQGAAYQFTIGVLQTLFAPTDKEEWIDRYEQPPSQVSLQQALAKGAHAFNMLGDGPLFMQDFDELSGANSTPVSALLIESPGAQSIKHNTDHFIKRGLVPTMSLQMAALALFTLQINAPAGGSGHRVGLRGGGPMTTLVLPSEPTSSLWQKLWLNVISRDEFNYIDPDLQDKSVFPWLGKTYISKVKGTEIYSHQIHELHSYWAMPRRIRLNVEKKPGKCAISGQPCEYLVRTFRTLNYGNNYAGNWSPHPFTPYRFNPKKPNEQDLSVKGQPNGINYNQWHKLTFTSEAEGQICARVVTHFNQLLNYFLQDELQNQLRLWAFAYDMDQMKARGYYSKEMPFFLVPGWRREAFFHRIRELQQLANEILWQTRSQIKSAWFNKPGEVKGDMSFIDLSFWQRTESVFFTAVAQLASMTQEQDSLVFSEAQQWLSRMQQITLALFDEQVLSTQPTQREMRRCVTARRQLTGWIYGSKVIKAFRTKHRID
jgi:CRISPR system Cascade subunit CasA